MWRWCASLFGVVLIAVAVVAVPSVAIVPSYAGGSAIDGYVEDGRYFVNPSHGRPIVEVSEWKSPEAIDAAHRNPNVLTMWKKFFATCECVPLKTLAEAEEMFPGFQPVESASAISSLPASRP